MWILKKYAIYIISVLALIFQIFKCEELYKIFSKLDLSLESERELQDNQYFNQTFCYPQNQVYSDSTIDDEELTLFNSEEKVGVLPSIEVKKTTKAGSQTQSHGQNITFYYVASSIMNGQILNAKLHFNYNPQGYYTTEDYSFCKGYNRITRFCECFKLYVSPDGPGYCYSYDPNFVDCLEEDIQNPGQCGLCKPGHILIDNDGTCTNSNTFPFEVCPESMKFCRAYVDYDVYLDVKLNHQHVIL